MTIEEQLEFLKQSTESLHATMHEMVEAHRKLAARERQGRKAVLVAMQSYLKTLDESDEGASEN